MGEARRKRLSVAHCYLCGQPLAEPISVDHVPPKLMYAKEIRQKHDLSRMLTIPVHAKCNANWKLDEEYFFHSLMPFARGSVSGDAAYRSLLARFREGRNVPLMNQVLQEFRQRVGGIILPAGRVAKLIDGDRAHDVIWKIIRGLNFHHTGEILPPNGTCAITFTAPDEKPPAEFMEYTASGRFQSRGPYPGVFAYCFDKFEEANNLHYWGLLLWDKILITAAFHDPACDCEYCSFIGPRLPESLANTRKV